jgi:hypothetical protein
MKIRSFVLACVIALFSFLPALAQGAVASYTMEVWSAGVNPASGSPVTSTTFLVGTVTCNQAAITVPGTVINPTRLVWDDPAVAGKVCIATINSTVLTALPNGLGYFVTLRAVDTAGLVSARSTASNSFNQQVPPPALTNVKLL